MSLLFMLLALVGCLLVLGGGSYVLRRVIAHLGSRSGAVEEDSGPSAVSAADRAQVGGYVPAPRPEAEGREPGELPPWVRARAANLVALGRTEEAVRLVRERAGADEARARRIVGALERSADSGPALEP